MQELKLIKVTAKSESLKVVYEDHVQCDMQASSQDPEIMRCINEALSKLGQPPDSVKWVISCEAH